MNDFPRRAIVEEMQPAELAITKAMKEVESLGADIKLTDAVIKLMEVKDLVSDFIDGR